MPLVLESALSFIEKNRGKLLWAVLFVAAILRLEGVRHGISYHPDERAIVMAVERLSLADFNPKFFAYGSLTFYLVWIVSSALSVFSSWYASYDGIFYVGRSVCLLIALGSLPLAYLLARKLTGSALAGLLSALLLALNPLHLQLSKFYTSDIILATIAAALLWTLLHACRERRPFWWLVAAALFGLAMATKVAGLFLVLPIAAAILIQIYSAETLWSRVGVQASVGVALAGAAGALIVLLPLVLSGDLRLLLQASDPGLQVGSWVSFKSASLETLGAVMLSAFAGLLAASCRQWWQIVVVGLVTVVNAAIIGGSLGIFLVLPSLVISASLGRVWQKLEASPLISIVFRAVCLAALVFLIASPYTLLDWSTFLRQVQEQTRMAAGEWRPPYTIQYEHTAPWLYQLSQAFSYTFGPEVFVVCMAGLLLCFFAALDRKHSEFWILLAWVVPTFLYTAALQVKYPRYLLPLYPAICVAGGYCLSLLLDPRGLVRYGEGFKEWLGAKVSDIRLGNCTPLTSGQRRALWSVLGVAAIGTFYRLADFPLYFFCDEAVHSVEARNLFSSMKDSDGRFLPLFVRGFGDFQWGLSVYIHVILEAVFGFTIVGVRATTAVCSLLALWWIGRISFEHLGLKNAWIAPLLLLGSSTWFLHARTGFENVLSVTLYLGFLLYYLRGLCGIPRSFVVAGALAGLCFYSYAAARGWVAVSLIFLLLGNLKFHVVRFRDTAWLFAGLFLVLLPFLRFLIAAPELALMRYEKVLAHRELEDLARNFFDNYLRILSPNFWFTWEGTLKTGSEERHVVAGIAPLGFWLLPAAVLGLGLLVIGAIRDLRSRSVLLVTLAIPVTASFFGLTIPRALALLPMFVLLAARGADAVLELVSNRCALGARIWLKAVVSLQLVGLFGYLVYYSLYQAPTKYSEYGFYGLQYGAPQVFDVTKRLSRQLEEKSKIAPRIFLSHALFNGNEIFPKFFFGKDQAELSSIIENQRLCDKALPGEEFVFVYRSEFAKDLERLSCLQIQSQEEILSPQGSPLFIALIGQARSPTSQVDQTR